jgi:site-specific DNA-methyltransferase (adenine-specific)
MLFKTWEDVVNSGNKYDLLYADPPWKYERDTSNLSGCASNRPDGKGYITMSDKDIGEMKMSEIASRNSVLCMWATGARLDSAIGVMHSWGFKYKTVLFVWQKISKSGTPRMVMGNYTRPSTEFILLGTRGAGIKIPVENKIHNMHQVVSNTIIGHSIKPNVFISRIQTLFHNPAKKIELFARVGFEGWDLFGDECEYSNSSLVELY